MKKVERLRDKNMFQALKSVDNPWELIAFIFTYRSKELLILAVVILIVLNLYPKIAEYILNLFK